MKNKQVLKQILILDKWFETNDYKGIDPYDLLDNILFHKIIRIRILLIRKIFRKIIVWFIFLLPNFTLKILKKGPNLNPKALGLILQAKCNLYEISGKTKYLEDAEKIAKKLIDIAPKEWHGLGWGYPFNWSSQGKFIPKDTPSAVVSVIIGEGFFKLFKLTRKSFYSNICKNIANFLVKDLNIDHIDDNKISFSYTPLDNNHVINSNLFVADYLVKIGLLFHKNNFVNLGKKILNYVLSQQLENGDFLYWGIEDRDKLKFSRSNSDHYHTGFELRKLFSLFNQLNDDKIRISFEKYYNFYINNYINADGSINLFPKRKYPINIHACAEALICNSIIKWNNNSKLDLNKIYNWISKTMVDKSGLFNYEIRNILGVKIINTFKFNRWAQAWMFLALTEYYKRILCEKK